MKVTHMSEALMARMNKAIESVRRRGAQARSEGKPRTANPYCEPGMRNAFARAFRRAWDEGWRSAAKGIAHGMGSDPDLGDGLGDASASLRD
jgi:hypothetical protein